MRIVSEFHDYYDTVQAAGQDQTVVYLRTRKEVELNHSTYPFPLFGGTPPRFQYGHRVPMVQIVAGFCSKIYPILRLSHQRRADTSPDIVLCYTLSEADAFIEGHFKEREIEAYRSNARKRKFPVYRWARGQTREMFEEFFDTCAAKRTAFSQLFLDSRCPIFVASTWWEGGVRAARKYRIVYNERLKELEFFRLIDTYTAYQEIQMYFGALAQPNRPIPEVPDKDMVSIKGFDKWSFRKPPKSPG